MAFLLYEYSKNSSGTNDYKRIKDVRLAGKEGAISIYISKINKQKNIEKPFPWYISVDEVLTNLNATPQNNSLIIDVKPYDKKRVSLYRLEEIWGFLYPEEWSPLLVRLESLFVDWEVKNPEKFKEQFNDQDSEKEVIYEFLYIRKDKKTWNWGMVGRINGALLWPNALRYFISVLNKSNRCC
jgi:hypothetical protein